MIYTNGFLTIYSLVFSKWAPVLVASDSIGVGAELGLGWKQPLDGRWSQPVRNTDTASV